MRASHTTIFVAGLLLVFCAVGILTQSLGADIKGSSDIAVVVSAQNPVNDIALDELRKILLGDQLRWKNKSKIMLVLPTPGLRQRTIVVSKIARMSDQDFNRWWAGKVFRGEADEPFTTTANGNAFAYIDVNPGGVAFVPGSDVRRDLKVLKINGLMPGDENYPLR